MTLESRIVGILLSCTPSGKILEILSDTLGSRHGFRVGKNLLEGLHLDSRVKAQGFLHEVREQTAAFKWELNGLFDGRPKLFHLDGWLQGDHMLISGTSAFLVDQEEPSRLRKKWPEDRQDILDELSRLNNELATTQRELVHRNSEIEAIVQKRTEELQHISRALSQRVEEISKLNQELKQADHYKDEFLSVIGHELRTPLNAVLGFGSILEDEVAGPLNETQKEYIGKLLMGADRTLVLVDNLLDFARLKVGKFGLIVADTDYPSLLNQTVGAFQPSAQRKRIRLECSVEEMNPVCLDRRRIEQVLANLLTNAIKFTPEGGWIKVKAAIKDGNLVTEVFDNGIGISPDDFKKLFSPFKQVDMSLTRKAGGIGLGLSIAKVIVTAHGGSLEVRSEEGKGSTFTFNIPLARAESKE